MSCLFDAFRIGPIEVKNRFVRSATAESRCDKDGIVRDDIIPIYEELAAGGVGVIISGHMYVLENSKCSPRQTGAWSDKHIPGMRRIAEASRHNDVRAVAQINSATRLPTDLSLDDIGEVRQAFIAAARRAMSAGFDGVQIHAAHGYLLSCFLTPSENARSTRSVPGGIPLDIRISAPGAVF